MRKIISDLYFIPTISNFLSPYLYFDFRKIVYLNVNQKLIFIYNFPNLMNAKNLSLSISLKFVFNKLSM